MRRTWLTVDVNSLRNELGLPAIVPPRPQAPGIGLFEPARNRGDGARPRPVPIQAGPGIQKTIQCMVYQSFPEAEEGAQIQIAANPALSLIIFEATNVIESVPTTPVPKKWTENGELVPR